MRVTRVTSGVNDGVVFVSVNKEKVVTVSHMRAVSVHKFVASAPDGEYPFTLEVDRTVRVSLYECVCGL